MGEELPTQELPDNVVVAVVGVPLPDPEMMPNQELADSIYKLMERQKPRVWDCHLSSGEGAAMIFEMIIDCPEVTPAGIIRSHFVAHIIAHWAVQTAVKEEDE